MPAFSVVIPVCAVVIEEFVTWRYGLAGLLGLLLLTVGLKADSPTCSSIGAVVLALLLAAPAV